MTIINDIPPSVLGMPQVGEELVATTGVWEGIPTSYDYQWQSAADIHGKNLTNVGTNSPSFTPVTQANYFRVGVTATNDTGSLQVFSDFVGSGGGNRRQKFVALTIS